MILHPHFFDHWKTRALVELTKRPESPLWLQRLWGHCQSNQQVTFRLPPIALKSICCVASEITPEQWFEYLLTCQFIEGDESRWTVRGWAEENAKLVANWKNGKEAARKRGPAQRKPKPALGEPKSELGQPTENPTPVSPPLIERIRSDGLDQMDQMEKTAPPKARKRAGCHLPSEKSDQIRDRMIAINALMKRRDSTQWQAKEFDAFKAAGLDTLPDDVWREQIEELTSYYLAPKARIASFNNQPGADYRRTAMDTLLNNWAGEVDRARKFCAWLKEKNDRDSAGRV